MKHFGAPPPFGKSEGAVHTVATSHRERDDNYRDVIALLAPRWRVICCRDGIQWILQKKEASHAGPWRGVKYCTTKNLLGVSAANAQRPFDDLNLNMPSACASAIIAGGISFCV